MANAKGKRRGGHYPVRRSIVLTEATAAALDRASDRFGVATGVLVREAIVRGLPLVIASRRRAARAATKREEG